MRKNVKNILVVAFGVLLIRCSPYHEGENLAASGTESLGADSVAIFEKTLFPVLSQNCTKCHGASQFPLFAEANALASQTALIDFGLVSLSVPENSRIVQKVGQGHQGFPSSLGVELVSAIQSWSDGLKESGGGVDIVPAVLEPTFSSIQKLILVPKCLGCHSPGGERPQEDYSTYETSMDTGGIKAGDHRDSELYKECDSGEMPEGDAMKLSDQQLSVVAEWIDDGAKNN